MTAMPQAAEPAVAVDVVLESALQLPDSIAPQIEALVGGAVTELGLPGRLRVRSPTADVPADAVRISVNGEQFLLGGVASLTPEGLAYLVAQALHAERSAWVTAACLDAIRAAIEPGATAPDDAVLLAAARELARRGVSVSRLAPAVSALDDRNGSDPVVLAEKAMAATTARLSVRVAPAKSTEVRAGRDSLDQVPEVLWSELGIIVPAVRVDADPAFSELSARVTVNDVGLPTETYPWFLSEPHIAAVRDAGLQHAGSLLTTQVVEFLLDRLAGAFPLVVSAARARLSDEQITAALRVLLDHAVPVSDLRAILEGLLEALHDSQDEPPANADELVKAAFPRLGLMLVRRHLQDGYLSVLKYDNEQADDAGLSEYAVARLHEDIAALNHPTGLVIVAAAANLAAQLRQAVRPRYPATLVVTPDDIPDGISVVIEVMLGNTGSRAAESGQARRRAPRKGLLGPRVPERLGPKAAPEGMPRPKVDQADGQYSRTTKS